ncbi:SDR family NAD(P)-dependent oxidoreductase [Clostridium folliculivorans]|uniref:Short-chain dehydrogenase n=1 Tax=Clostridium folliculivorans TaxID=2886038 RepID=A0A9W5Y1P5_9CLOT|nr:SDR family NAD(P)-dependent oxidoreductase [Clostridium folliculivorans]GKU24971.1 short-chain dehydrogenase [Clostridium folliculivorans]GKU31069.1 short-chain dehydrogenase [Clostridium folliculivorans]
MKKQSIIVLTGATSGLGQLVATELAKRDFHLVLTARSKSKAEETKSMLKSINPEVKVDFFYGDLSSMKDVKRIGDEISNTYSSIDILINNAGLHAFEQRITEDGFSEMIAVNYLAPWLLTHTLQKILRNSGAATVVNVASEASRNHGKLKLPEDLMDTSTFTARESSSLYGKTKLLDIMFTGELARTFSGTGVTVNALNPGFNVTGLGRELAFASVLERILNFLHIGDPKRGADIIVRIATESKYKEVTGGYFNVGTGKSINPIYPCGDEEIEKKLWAYTEEIFKSRGLLQK